MFRLFFLFTVVPATELWILFQLTDRIGFFETIWLIIITGMLGAAMAKREGVKVIHDLQSSLQKGEQPGAKIIEGLLVLVGGLLLITPGVMTDIFGFSLIFPFTRRRLAPLIQKAATQQMAEQSAQGTRIHFGAIRPGPAMREKQDPGTVNIESSDPEQTKDKPVFNHPTF